MRERRVRVGAEHRSWCRDEPVAARRLSRGHRGREGHLRRAILLPPGRAPGSYAGPFSALSPSAAVFIDFCPACGPGTAPWDLATGAGATLAVKGNVGKVNIPQAASFASAQAGWVAGSAREFTSGGKTRSQQRIVATTDGGRTWQVQYATPWTPWTG